MLGIANSRNALIHVSDGASFYIGVSLCSFSVICPAYVKKYTDSAILLMLIPVITDVATNLTQTLSVYLTRQNPQRNPVRDYWITEMIHRLSFVLIGISIFLFSWSPVVSLVSFYLLFIASNISWGFAMPNWVDCLSLTLPDAVRSSFMGKREFLSRLFGIAAVTAQPFLLGLAAFPQNYGLLFVIAGVFFTAGAVPIRFFQPIIALREERREHLEGGFGKFLKDGAAMVFGNKKLLPFLAVTWSLSVSRITYAFFTPYVIDRVISKVPGGNRDVLVSVLNITLLVFLALTAWLVGRLTTRFGHRKVLMGAIFSFAASNLLVLAVPVFPVVLAATFLLAFFMNSSYLVTLNAIMDFTPPHLRSTATAFNNSVNALFILGFGAVGSLVGSKFGYGTAMLTAAVLILAGVVLLFRAPMQEKAHP
jgi:hypothetical protein